jgi:steroid 5-alpha reductase family enzyme
LFIMTGMIFVFSVMFNNSSLFDPFWSVAPLFVFFFLLWNSSVRWFLADGASTFFQGRWYGFSRFFLLFILISWWGSRLTWNFFRNWKGLKHEDWRYGKLRENTGSLYWLVSLFGIHLFPAFMVFLGSLSLWVVLTESIRHAGLLDLTAFLICGFAIWMETKADRQLFDHLKKNRGNGKLMKQGLWSVSRHPNYLGEICFWWGLYFFGLSANPSFWWIIIGPISITLMFVFISIPMIEKRLNARYPEYQEYSKDVRMLVPW